MKEDTKRAKLAALFGLEEHLPTTPTPDQAIEKATASREAEATLAYVSNQPRFKYKNCKECGEQFAVDRGNVAYCKDECRKVALERIGIIWDPKKDPRERWDFKVVISNEGDKIQTVLAEGHKSREPLTVPPPALVVANLAIEQQTVMNTQEQAVVGLDVVPLDTSDVPQVSDAPLTPIVIDL